VANHRDGDDSEHWAAAAAAQLIAAPGTLVPGQRLGPYQIVSFIAAGGMGAVYRARDPRMGREVAIKVVTEHFSERFAREVRAVAALNHPNICTLYDVGPDYLVMEYIEGAPLRGPVPPLEAVALALEIAGALEAAHVKDIVHRDLKPGNILVTPSGVKLLDFGLATSMRVAGNDESCVPRTLTGIVLGTAAYMSPEQAGGKPVDARSDIFSFGLVFYELLSGRRAFSEANAISTMAAILHKEPEPLHAPAELVQCVTRCLRKDPADRFQTMSEVKAALQKAQRSGALGGVFWQHAGSAVSKPGIAQHPQIRRWLLGAVGVLLLAVAILYEGPSLSRRLSPPVQPTHRQVTFVGDATYPTLSPDGQFIAYVTGKPLEGQDLMLLDLKGEQAINLLKTTFISNPRWSPDGTELAAFRDEKPEGIFLIPRLGGLPRHIAHGKYPGWSSDGSQIATASQDQLGFTIVDKVSGSVRNVHLSGFQWLNDLDWSPTTNSLAVLTALKNGRQAIWTVHPDGSAQRKVIEEDTLDSPRWTATGDGIYFLRFRAGGTRELLKIAIDSKSGRVTGPASVLMSGLQTGQYFTVSADGTRLAYSRVQGYSNLWLARFQSTGNGSELQETPLTTGTAFWGSPTISPDGRSIAYVAKGHIYKMPIGGGTPVQLTFSDGAEFSPAWSPDGKRIAFGSSEGGSDRVWIIGARGGHRRELRKTHLVKELGQGKITWSPGSQILYQQPGNRNFIVCDPETGEEKPLVPNESVGWMFAPKVSPDGKKVAVLWNRRSQRGLWVISLIDNSQTFLGGDYRRSPVGWSPDGSSVYAHNSNNMLSIPVLGRGATHTVFSISGTISGASVSTDGKTFVYSRSEMKSDVWIVDNFDPAYRK
jgi:Tol biopolymer transport system component/predicted Ser/Thr protein kinase